MGSLDYTVIGSLDGYTADEDGRFDWAFPDEEVHRFANGLEAGVRMHLYGRRMYETMRVWETIDAASGADPAEVEYGGIWRGLDKVVYSRTLPEVTTARTRLERAFDPDSARALADATDGAVSISGPTLAAHALRAGIVDDIRVFTVPVLVGGGTPIFPRGLRLHLELLEQRRFANGTAFHRYRPARNG